MYRVHTQEAFNLQRIQSSCHWWQPHDLGCRFKLQLTNETVFRCLSDQTNPATVAVQTINSHDTHLQMCVLRGSQLVLSIPLDKATRGQQTKQWIGLRHTEEKAKNVSHSVGNIAREAWSKRETALLVQTVEKNETANTMMCFNLCEKRKVV